MILILRPCRLTSYLILKSIIKKASLFLGASLVGIAPMDERWLYSNYYDMFESGGAPIEITKVEIPELPAGQVSSEQAGVLILL